MPTAARISQREAERRLAGRALQRHGKQRCAVEFHNGIRRPVKFSDRAKPFMLDRNAWHELKMTVDGSSFRRGSTALWRSTSRLAPTRVRDVMASRRILTSFLPTIRAADRPWQAGSCGRKPTAPATLKTTSSLPSNSRHEQFYERPLVSRLSINSISVDPTHSKP